MGERVIVVLLDILVIYNILFAFLIIFFEKRNPASTWAWLMVVLLVPYVGSFIYLIGGLEPRKHRTFRDKSAKDAENALKIAEMKLPGLDYQELSPPENGGGFPHDLVFLNHSAGGGALTYGNNVTAYFEGEDKFAALIRDIEKAEKYIHLQYYIFRNDGIGERLVEALTEKAAKGVEVLVMIDGMGNLFVPRRMFKPLLEAGGRLAVFIPPRFIRLNYRNHRKICVIDGKTGYVGGLNIGDEYLGKSRRFGHWRDCHLRIEGGGAKELEKRFMQDWNYLSDYRLEPGEFYFPRADAPPGAVPVQIVSSGPDTEWPGIHQSYIKMINEADKSIYMQTPYFIPDDAVLESLKIAALSGVDVRIVIPGNPDHPFVYWASTSYLSDLIKAGVKCYLYKNGFLHSKMLIIDEKAASVGTANMDVRSFKLNFEINAFVFGGDFCRELSRRFFSDLDDCVDFGLKDTQNRNPVEKVKEAFSRLISPLL